MTNFEQYKANLTEEQFIDSMLLNCDACPIPKYKRNCARNMLFGADCEDVLREWIKKEVTE